MNTGSGKPKPFFAFQYSYEVIMRSLLILLLLCVGCKSTQECADDSTQHRSLHLGKYDGMSQSDE
jgi:hypothetical protein